MYEIKTVLKMGYRGTFHLLGPRRLYTWTTIIAFTWSRQVWRGVPWSMIIYVLKGGGVENGDCGLC